MFNTLNLTLTPKKLHNLQKRQVTISQLMLEIRLESMQETELRLHCFIITGGLLKVRLVVSPQKQLRSCHATRGNSDLITPQVRHNG